MTGFVAVFFTVLAAANPPTAALTIAWPRHDRKRWRCRVLVAVASMFALLWLVAALSGPILDVLSVSVGTWRLATAVLLAPAGLRWLLFPARPLTDEPTSKVLLAVLALTVLFTPQLVAVTIASASKDGAVATVIALAASSAAIVALLLAHRLPTVLLAVIARLLGGLAVVFAIALGVDGTQTL